MGQQLFYADGCKTLNEEDIKVKFGFVTTEATTEMRLRARKAGALFLLPKPFTVETFQVRLQPENSTMKPIFVDPATVEVQGKVMAVMRMM